MSLSEVMMQIKYSDLKQLEEEKIALSLEVANLKTQITRLQLAGDDGRTEKLFQAFTQAMEVVRFAVGNLHPLTVRGWPYEALRALAKALPAIPGSAHFQAELAVTFDYFAGLCEKWETARAEGREKEVLAEENAARAPSAATLAALGIVPVQAAAPLDLSGITPPTSEE